jgi:hypothetical protein
MKLLIQKNVGSVALLTDVGDNMTKRELFSDAFMKHIKNVQKIDRKEENKLVTKYQNTDDMSILEDIYIKRIPTLANWALQHYYPGLELSINDFMEELSIVFMKAANKYNIQKGSFNTCLFTYLTNRIKNMKNSTHAKKRRPEYYDGPISGVLLSLDHVYSSDKNGCEKTLGDFLLDKDGGAHSRSVSATNFNETVNALSDGDEVMRTVFSKLGEGLTLSAIIRDFKTLRGDIKITSKESEDLKSNDYTNLKEIISKKVKLTNDNFSVTNYKLLDNCLHYTVEYKDTANSKMIQKKIKNIRKNKEQYLSRIR